MHSALWLLPRRPSRVRPGAAGKIRAQERLTEAEHAPRAPKLGVLYAARTFESFSGRDRIETAAEEVVYDAVWIRREPNAKGDKLTKRSRTAKSKVFVTSLCVDKAKGQDSSFYQQMTSSLFRTRC